MMKYPAGRDSGQVMLKQCDHGDAACNRRRNGSQPPAHFPVCHGDG